MAQARKKRSTTRRSFTPAEAAYAVAQFLPADPALWLERCALAGITVATGGDGSLITAYAWNDFCADQEQAAFLDSWLNSTPGARAAVVALLEKRYSETAAA